MIVTVFAENKTHRKEQPKNSFNHHSVQRKSEERFRKAVKSQNSKSQQ
jgi:hypothetical protein